MFRGDGKTGELFVDRIEVGSGTLGMGGQEWAKQFAECIPVIGVISEPGVYPERPRADPELTPRQLLTNAKYRIRARASAVTYPREGQLWEDALWEDAG